MDMTQVGNHFSPFTGPVRPCWHCRWWAGFDTSGTHGRCSRAGACPVQATPRDGCAFFEREVGADDEPGPPGDAQLAGAGHWRAMVAAPVPRADLHRPGPHPLLVGA